MKLEDLIVLLKCIRINITNCDMHFKIIIIILQICDVLKQIHEYISVLYYII